MTKFNIRADNNSPIWGNADDILIWLKQWHRAGCPMRGQEFHYGTKRVDQLPAPFAGKSTNTTRDKEIVQEHVEQGLSAKDIAARHGISQSRVKQIYRSSEIYQEVEKKRRQQAEAEKARKQMEKEESRNRIIGQRSERDIKIINLFETGKYTQDEIAAQLGISQAQVSKVIIKTYVTQNMRKTFRPRKDPNDPYGQPR